MQNSICLIIVRNEQGGNEIANTVRVGEEVVPGKWLATFLNPPPFQRVVNVEEIQQWMVFPNQAAADNWVRSSSAEPPEQAELPITDPDDDDADCGDGSGRTNVEKRADDEAAASKPNGDGE
jgi:hypothetical protein